MLNHEISFGNYGLTASLSTASTSNALNLPYQLSNCPTRILPSNGPIKRERTKFHPNQLQILERFFERKMYPDGYERERLAQTLSLTETKVQIWFKNRRAKFRAQKNLENMIRARQDSSANEGSKDENSVDSPPPEPKHRIKQEDKGEKTTRMLDREQASTPVVNTLPPTTIPSLADVNFKMANVVDSNLTSLHPNVSAWMPMSYPINQYPNMYANGFGFMQAYPQAHNMSQYSPTPYDLYNPYPSYYNTSSYNNPSDSKN